METGEKGENRVQRRKFDRISVKTRHKLKYKFTIIYGVPIVGMVGIE